MHDGESVLVIKTRYHTLPSKAALQLQSWVPVHGSTFSMNSMVAQKRASQPSQTANT
jgi:hypothetical protein